MESVFFEGAVIFTLDGIEVVNEGNIPVDLLRIIR